MIEQLLARATLMAMFAAPCVSCHSSLADLSGSTAPAGTFALTTLNGKALPDTLGRLPSLIRQPIDCLEIVTKGWLTLDTAAHSFVLARHSESNCGTRFGSDTVAVGDYRSRGDSLRLMAFTAADSISIAASITSTQIMVDDPGDHRRDVFRR